MNLKEALSILGVERVKKGMRAIDNRRKSSGPACTCFIGEAFAGANDDETALNYLKVTGYYMMLAGSFIKYPKETQDAAILCEAYYEGFTSRLFNEFENLMDIKTTKTRKILRETCIEFLAENGEAIEPCGPTKKSKEITVQF